MQRTQLGWKRTLRGAGGLFLVGMLGVVALAVQTVPTLRESPGLGELSYPVLLVLASVNSAILLAVFAVVGAFAAPRVGLQSNLFAWATGTGPDWAAVRGSLGRGAGIGAGLFLLTAALDLAFAPFLAFDGGATLTAAESLRALYLSVPMRLLYGGVTEELLLRWGVMAPIAWLGWRIRGRSENEPNASTMWAAILLSALLFGVGHLPSLASTYDLTLLLVVRTVLLNTIAGAGFGWLFWQDSLETAMVSHIAFHVTLVAVSTVLLV